MITFILIISFALTQNQSSSDILQQIQDRAKSIKLKYNPELEEKYLHAKALERSSLYDEALLLFKEINRANPGISKYFLPLKHYLKQKESWDSLLVYTQSFSDARNNDLQAMLEFLDIYIIMDLDEEWAQLSRKLVLDSEEDEKISKHEKSDKENDDNKSEIEFSEEEIE